MNKRKQKYQTIIQQKNENSIQKTIPEKQISLREVI
jgi:hypothetical protein